MRPGSFRLGSHQYLRMQEDDRDRRHCAHPAAGSLDLVEHKAAVERIGLGNGSSSFDGAGKGSKLQKERLFLES